MPELQVLDERVVPVGAAVAPAPARPMPPAAPARAWRPWRRLGRYRNGIAGALIVGLLGAVALAAPMIAPRDPLENDLRNALRPPGSPGFPLGTDNLGRDILSRVVWGSRISLTVGIVVQSTAVAAGTLLGLIAGFYGRWVDDAVWGATSVMLALPRLLFAMAIVAALGPGLINLFIALGIVGWPSICRVVRAQTLALCGKDFVEAARALGATDLRIMARHLVPNVLGPIVVLGTVGMGRAILTEASLSFLGLGIQPPTPSWGTMMSRGQAYIWSAPWLLLFPGLAVFLAVLGLNLLGDGLRDLLDPHARTR
jgi:ABC-type dipeptide/oligopeptide/nickel transport system permease subunit